MLVRCFKIPSESSKNQSWKGTHTDQWALRTTQNSTSMSNGGQVLLEVQQAWCHDCFTGEYGNVIFVVLL